MPLPKQSPQMADKSSDKQKRNVTCSIIASNGKGAQRAARSARPFYRQGERDTRRNGVSLKKIQQVTGQEGRYAVEAGAIAAKCMVTCAQVRTVLPGFHLSQDFRARWPLEQHLWERVRSCPRLPKADYPGAALKEEERNLKVARSQSMAHPWSYLCRH